MQVLLNVHVQHLQAEEQRADGGITILALVHVVASQGTDIIEQLSR